MSQVMARTALVTGASHGIGAAIVERLARDGFSVVVNYSESEQEAHALVRKVAAAGGQATAVKADVTDPGAVAAMFAAAEQAFGPVAALVNNAGVMKLSTLAETDDASFDQHVAVNLKGVFNCLREGARRMHKGGRIVSVSSSVVGFYQPAYGVYAATKAGVEAMTHVLAKELGPKGIAVNAVAPGPVATRLFLDGKSEEQVRQVAKMIPMGRLGEPADIADAVAFLCGPDAHWVSGQVIRANGGAV